MNDDRTTLVELLADFAAATDARAWETIAALLTEDAYAYGAQGPVAVVERMQDHLGGVGPTQHLLGNHRVRIDADSLGYISLEQLIEAITRNFPLAFLESSGQD